MKFTMKDEGPPLSPHDILQVERRLGVTLPEDYKAFLFTHNGGRPNLDAFPIHGMPMNPNGGIQKFYGIIRVMGASHIESSYSRLKGKIPPNLFPIACTDGGSEVCLSLWGDDQGAVYLWDWYDREIPPTYKNVYLIARSFQEFLDSIHSWNPLEGIDVDVMQNKQGLDE